MKDKALAAAALLLTAVAAFLLLSSIPYPPAAASPRRYELESAEKYTYGPFDEIRIDRTYRASEDGPVIGIPKEGFLEMGVEYEYLFATYADDGTCVVTFGARKP